MDNLCKQIVTAVLVLPWIAGRRRNNPNGLCSYDGTFSSLVLSLTFLGVIIVFTATKGIQSGSEIRLSIAFWLMTAFMIFGTVSCIIMGLITKKIGIEHFVQGSRNDSTTKLQVIFLWIFAILSILFCVFMFGQQIECGLFSSVHDENGLFWDARFSYNFSCMVFLITETIFITFFSSFRFKYSVGVHYVMFILIVANISVLSHSLLIQDDGLPENFKSDQTIEMNNLSSCLQNGTIGDLIDGSKAILTPGLVEYGLLCITIILEIWSPNGDYSAPITDYEEDHYNTGNEQTSLLLHSQYAQMNNNADSVGYTGTPVSHMISIVVSIMLGGGYFIGYIVLIRESGSKEHIRYVMEIYDEVLSVMLIITGLVGFFCLSRFCKPIESKTPLQSREYVYLLSGFGLIIINISKLVAGTVTQNENSKLTIATFVIDALQVYLEIVFLLQANRFRRSSSNVWLLECILIFVLVLNLVFWMTDSFLFSQFPETRNFEQIAMGGILHIIIYKVLYPIAVFFRFSSFLEYFSTYKKFNTRS